MRYWTSWLLDGHNEGIRIDLLVVNDSEAVLVDVTSKLTPSDVDEHLENLAKFRQALPRYADVRTIGAVAAMVLPPVKHLSSPKPGGGAKGRNGQCMAHAPCSSGDSGVPAGMRPARAGNSQGLSDFRSLIP
ncbi:MAG: hypothetical protein J5X22_09105 [Candidatus Accumulibacter sp.]|uniref:Uncharacterized protein n=1 Tax=Candidatus Accumulibacter cognatus TaxID=2954383 RepID=A0A7D5N800_9PROT|nr:hypothetical protein [Accumulibacter sp.]MBO3710660.1 hypothetical protein [Accumulibacter sp.]QLH48354.1 MAG: hypothetical protein HWD57_22645 [Candidatus Accumulibacter cognatus]